MAMTICIGEPMSNIYNFKVKTIDGSETTLEKYKGQVLLIVNTASKCGFTSQYKGLEDLFKKYQDKGFQVLAFPCNQFGAQEPGDEKEIQSFCSLTYDVSFPLFAKIDVNGDEAAPLYNFLKSNVKGLLGSETIKWNFTKFLVDSTGKPIKRYAPQTKPEDIEKDIIELLN